MKTLLPLMLLFLIAFTGNAQSSDCDAIWEKFQASESWSSNRRNRAAQVQLNNYKLCLKATGNTELLNKIDGFETIQPFYEGFSIAKDLVGNWLIDSTFTRLFRLKYSDAEYAGNGYIIVATTSNTYGIIDSKGVEATPAKCSFIQVIRNPKEHTVQFIGFDSGSLQLLNSKFEKVKTVNNYSFAHCYFNRFLYVEFPSKEGLFLDADFNPIHSGGKYIKFLDTKNHVLITNSTVDSTYMYAKSGEFIKAFEGMYQEMFSNDENLVFRSQTKYNCYNIPQEKLSIIAYREDNDRFLDGKGGYFILEKKGKMGVVNCSGEHILPFEYEHCRFIETSWFEVKLNGINYFYNHESKTRIKVPATAVELKELNKKYEGIDFGKYPFKDLKFSKHDYETVATYDYINSQEKNVTGRIITYEKNFRRSDIYLEIENGVCTVRSIKTGKIRTFEANSVTGMSTSYLFIRNGKMGLINSDGLPVLEPLYDDIQEISEANQAFIVTKNGLKGVVLVGDFPLIDCKYNNISFFENTFYCRIGAEGSKTENYTTTGKPLFAFGYDYSTPIHINDKPFTIVSKNGLYGLYNDSKSTLTIPTEYAHLDFQHNLFIVDKEGGQGVVNENNEVIIPITQSMIFPNKAGFTILKDDNVSLYNTSKRETVKTKYTSTDTDYLSEIIVLKNGKWGIISPENKVIIPVKYDQLLFSDYPDLFWFKLNEKWGLLNLSGKVLYPAELLEVNAFDGSKARVKTSSGDATIDNFGKINQ